MTWFARLRTTAPERLAILVSFTLAAACVPVGGPAVPAVNVSVQPHFGFPAASTPLLLEIHWPDGEGSNLIIPFAAGGRVFVERSD